MCKHVTKNKITKKKQIVRTCVIEMPAKKTI